jgi:hypothetical protein
MSKFLMEWIFSAFASPKSLHEICYCIACAPPAYSGTPQNFRQTRQAPLINMQLRKIRIDLEMIDPFNISLNAADRVGERSRSQSVVDRRYPTPMNSMSPMALPFDSAQGTPFQ